MRKIFSIVAMATLMVAGMASCSNNDEIESKAPASQSMKFNVLADGTHVTRGLATNASALAFSDFQTWAYDQVDGGLYMGDAAATGRTVSLVSGDWTYTPVQFWPLNPLNFVAIAPAAANGITNGTEQDGTSKVVTLTSSAVLSTNVEDQDDIMFSSQAAIDKDDDAGDVSFSFKHALSQIVFKGKLPTSGAVTKVVIDEITLGGIGNTGTLSVTSAGVINGGLAQITATNPSVFQLDATDLDEETFEVGASDVVAGTAFDITTSNSSVFAAGNAWFMLPQTTTAWVPSSEDDLKAGALSAAPTTGSYLKIRAQLKKDDVVILENDQPIYIPLAANWDRSKKYIYTIEFNGTAALTPITFSVTAEDWTEADPQPGQISM